MKKKELYIFNSITSRAAVYGIGTYINQLIRALKNTEWKLNMVYLYTEGDEVEMIESEGYRRINIPFPSEKPQNINLYYAKVIAYILKDFTLQNRKTEYIFHLNFMIDKYLAKYLKKHFRCKIILVSHYTDWSFQLLGDVNKLKKLLQKPKKELKDPKEKSIVEGFKEDVKMIKQVDRLVCVAHHTWKVFHHIGAIPDGKTEIIQNALEDIYFPDVVEITLVRRKDICENDILKEPISYPVAGLDYPNNPAYKDYPLRFYFTNSTKKSIETMITNNKQAPILIIAIAPIETMTLLFDRLKQIEPQRLYLVCDRKELNEIDDYFQQIKQLMVGCDWHCRIKTLYNKRHLGYEQTRRKAILWFFRHEPEGIILDGYITPSPGVLAFYSTLLEKYRNDERIGHIAGWNFLNENPISNNDSYYFSKLFNITGCWASWRRVWKDFDTQLKTLSAFKKQGTIDHIPTHQPFNFPLFLKHSLETQLEYVNLINNRLSVVPNIRYNQIISDSYELNKINHPLFITNNHTIDLKYQELKYSIPAITKNVPDGFHYIKDQLLSTNNPEKCKMKIPRIIHQIYEDPAGPPELLSSLAETWKGCHPEWEYRFWNKQMMYDFLDTVCPDFKPIYYSYPFNVQRWDAIRYLILYHIGGLYVDFDYECLEPLDVLLNGQSCCMGMEPTINSISHFKPLIIGNALMASVPKHPYMAAIIEDMKTNFSNDYRKGDSIQIMESTGPFMVTRVYEQFKRKKEITLLSADLVTPLSLKEVWMLRTSHTTVELEEKVEKAFAIHYFFGSWTEQTNEGREYKKVTSDR